MSDEKYNQIISHIREFEKEIEKITEITVPINELQDTTVAHVDRKHVNNPSALFKNQPIRWDDLVSAILIVNAGLLELGKHLGLGDDFTGYTQLAIYSLSTKTK